MEYQKPIVVVVKFQEEESIMDLSTPYYGLTFGSGWFKPLSLDLE